MKGELFTLLQNTGCTIEDVNDGTPNVQGDIGCEGINMDRKQRKAKVTGFDSCATNNQNQGGNPHAAF